MKKKDSRETLQAIKDIIDNEVGGYLRFGDSEIEIMADWQKARTHFRRSKEMQDDFREIFSIKDKNWLISVIPFSQEYGMKGTTFGGGQDDRMKELLYSVLGEKLNTQTFYNPIALHYLSLFDPDLLIDFIKNYIHSKKTIIIGGGHLKSADKFFKNEFYLQTQDEDKAEIYFQLDELYPKIKDIIEKNKIKIVLLGCGIASGIIQKKLWEDKVKTVTLDIGSLFDIMLRIQSRGWINDNPSLISNFMEKWSNSQS